MKTMPLKPESQSYRGFKIPNLNPFLSKAAKHEYEPSHGLLRTLETQHDAPSSSGPHDSCTDWHTLGSGAGRRVP